MQFVLIYKVCYIASWKGGDFIVNLIDYKFKCLYDLKVDKKYAVKFEKLEKDKNFLFYYLLLYYYFNNKLYSVSKKSKASVFKFIEIISSQIS